MTSHQNTHPHKRESMEAVILRLALAGKTRGEMRREAGYSLEQIRGAVSRLRSQGKLNITVPFGDIGIQRNPDAPESMRMVIRRITDAGGTMADIATHIGRPLNKVRHECLRLVNLGQLKALPPVGCANQRGAALKAARQAAWKPKAAFANAIIGARPCVSMDEAEMIAAHLATKGVTECPPRYADGATPEPDQHYQFRTVGVAVAA